MRDKRQKADILLDAIGQIDDRFIFEAERATPSRSRSPIFKRLAVIGLCVAMASTLVVSAIVGALIIDELRPTAPKPPYVDEAPIQTGSIAEELTSLKYSTADMSAQREEIDLFDGSAKVIWKYSDEEYYRVCSIDSYSAERIADELVVKADFTEISEAAPSELEGVWISFGDGLVYSPCLRNAKGNIGFGTIFNYDPELEPSSEFTELLISAIKAEQ